MQGSGDQPAWNDYSGVHEFPLLMAAGNSQLCNGERGRSQGSTAGLDVPGTSCHYRVLVDTGQSASRGAGTGYRVPRRSPSRNSLRGTVAQLFQPGVSPLDCVLDFNFHLHLDLDCNLPSATPIHRRRQHYRVRGPIKIRGPDRQEVDS